MKKTPILALAASALFLAWRPAAAVPMFSDVPTTHWAYDAVRALAEKGIIEGYPGTGERVQPAKKKPAAKPAPHRKLKRKKQR